MSKTVGVLSAGDMGSAIGQALHDAGARVVTSVAGRSAETAARAAKRGLETLPDIDEVVRQSDLVMCVVTSLAAAGVARSVAGAMRRTGAHPFYLDANSIGPHTARTIDQEITAAGGTFVDGSIIGTAQHMSGGRHTFYLSGARAADVANYLAPPFNLSILGTEPDQASGFKVLYAGLTKGMAALGVELLAGAERLGLRESLMEKYRIEHPGVIKFWEGNLPPLPSRARRRSEEMSELADTYDVLGLTAHTARGAQATLAALAAQHRADDSPETPTLDEMVAWWAQIQAGARA